MKRIIFLLSLFGPLFLLAQNIQFRSNLTYSGSLANIGGYRDTTDHEYALVGTDFGLSIVDVTDPDTPVIRFTVPGASSTWREVKTYRKYAYVTTEGGGGLTVVNLTYLPDSISYHQYTGDGAIAGQLNSIHALHCDTAKGFLYLYGSNIGGGNSLFFDLSDPWNPAYAGEYVYPGGGSSSYVHDGYVLNDTMYEAHIYDGFFAVVDVTDKSNPVLLATQTTPTAFTHNTWLSDDHHTLFTTDENSGSYLTAYDISDLSNITELSRFQTTPGSGSIVHNTHILNDYAITSWYKDGVVITDVSRPSNPVEVGRYDTYPQGSGDGFSGCWGVYPFLPSGNLVASDINNGLFVLTPTYIRGCYLEGIVTDSVTGFAIPNAAVAIVTTTVTRNTDASGTYRAGTVVAGVYDVTFTKAGYVSKTITAVSLNNGALTTLNVQLSPLPTIAVGGQVTDSITGDLIAGALVEMKNTDFDFNTISDANGNFSFNSVLAGTYDFIAGKWGHVTKCFSVSPSASNPIQVQLAPGYYDDFSFDFGWMVSGTSSNAWERGEPVGTWDGNNTPINPDFDVTGDCSDQCYVTDNGGDPYNNHDVDNGNTLLTSPVFDATLYSDPYISYSRWFVNNNGNGSPNDTMKILLSNGTTTVTLENVTANSVGAGGWYSRNYLISAFLPPTGTMRLMADIADVSPGNILEGGLDVFQLNGVLTPQSVNPGLSQQVPVRVYPNPSNLNFTLTAGGNEITEIIVYDAMGREVWKSDHPRSGFLRFGDTFERGVYLVRLRLPGEPPRILKLVKE